MKILKKIKKSIISKDIDFDVFIDPSTHQYSSNIIDKINDSLKDEYGIYNNNDMDDIYEHIKINLLEENIFDYINHSGNKLVFGLN